MRLCFHYLVCCVYWFAARLTDLLGWLKANRLGRGTAGAAATWAGRRCGAAKAACSSSKHALRPTRPPSGWATCVWRPRPAPTGGPCLGLAPGEARGCPLVSWGRARQRPLHAPTCASTFSSTGDEWVGGWVGGLLCGWLAGWLACCFLWSCCVRFTNTPARCNHTPTRTHAHPSTHPPTNIAGPLSRLMRFPFLSPTLCPSSSWETSARWGTPCQQGNCCAPNMGCACPSNTAARPTPNDSTYLLTASWSIELPHRAGSASHICRPPESNLFNSNYNLIDPCAAGLD